MILTETRDIIRWNDYVEYASEKAENANLHISESVEPEIGSKLFLNRKQIRKKISFTPYIYNRCSADCVFCSEKLIREETPLGKGYVNVADNYESKLQDVLKELSDVELFLSISGMEPLESLPFLEKVLNVFQLHEQNGGCISQKVIYTNLSAMAHSASRIIDLLQHHQISRVETSRHHYDEKINRDIMQFRPKQAIVNNSCYEQAVMQVLKVVPVRLACVVQQTGVNSISEVVRYIDWASGMGITNITFRELSILGDHFTDAGSYEYIAHNRTSIFSLLEKLTSDFCLVEIVKGYYYFTFRYLYKDAIEISFEVSDYEQMIKSHHSSTIDKLVYYPNGDLCTDWNMQQKIY